MVTRTLPYNLPRLSTTDTNVLPQISCYRRTGGNVHRLRKYKNFLYIVFPDDCVAVSTVPFIRSHRFHTLNDRNGSRKPLLDHRNQDFRSYQIPNYTSKRGMSMLVFRFLRGALKIRYLILGGAVGGGYTLQKVSNCKAYTRNAVLASHGYFSFAGVSRMGRRATRFLLDGQIRTKKRRLGYSSCFVTIDTG